MPLFRRCWLELRHLVEVVRSPAFWFEDAEGAAGFVEDGGVDRPRASLSGCHRRWRGQIYGKENPGRGPGRRDFGDAFIPFLEAGCLLRLNSKLSSDGILLAMGSMVAGVVVSRRAAAISGDCGKLGFQGPRCNFHFFLGSSSKFVRTAVSSVSF
ncbi:unnamed protein product [Urochloa humidicola]